MAETCRSSWITRVGSDSIINGLKTIFQNYYTNTIVVNVAKPWGGTLDMYLSRGVELTKYDSDGSGSYFSVTWEDVWVTSSGIAVEVKICRFTAPAPPADPCEGVVCEPTCVGVDRYSSKCVDGLCWADTLLEENAALCGYVPPVDPCAGVVCGPKCVGDDLYRQNCVDGVCGPDLLLQENAVACGYVSPVVEEAPIGTITHVVHEELGADEITFKIPITNRSSRTTYNYIKLFDASGKYLEKEPDILFKSIAPGDTKIMTITSEWRFWSIKDVQGQTVMFKLFSSFSTMTWLVPVDTKTYSIATYEEKPPYEVPPYEEPPYEEPPYEEPPYEEPPYEEPPYEEPPYEEPPYEEPPIDEEDNVLMYIALFAIAYAVFSNG